MTQDAPTEGMLGSDFVDAYATATGKLQTIPAHWLDDPVIGAGFTLDPPTAADLPSMRWNLEQLTEYAETVSQLEVPEGATKAQILAAISGEQRFPTLDPVV